nr:DUF4276 family protein [uncultured Rhodopila sp.]
MTRILLLVEGQTEEAFVNLVLRPHLLPLGVFVERPSLLRTKELPEGNPFKGGVTTYPRMARDVRRLLKDTNARVTTLLDYYGLPPVFPGLGVAKAQPDPLAPARALEASFTADINHPRFHPFLALHELEAWILAVPHVAEKHLGVSGLAAELQGIVLAAGGAELVNDSPITHPSVRLADAVQRLGRRRYGKMADGPDILAKAGLATIRSCCPHLSEWLDWLESLA